MKERLSQIAKNRIEWNGNILRVPHVYVDPRTVSVDEIDDERVQVTGIDPSDTKWLQIGVFASLSDAKTVVSRELDIDTESVEMTQNGGIVVTIEDLRRTIVELIPPLQKPVSEYLEAGITPSGFGPAILLGETRDSIVQPKNAIGVWRPIYETESEIGERHRNS